MIDTGRIKKLNKIDYTGGDIVYWMSRDQRVEHNWALLYARELAEEYGVDMEVVFCLVPRFPGATLRQYGFMLGGLKQVERDLRDRNIPFYLLKGEPGEEIPPFVSAAGALVVDFDPLKIKRKWKRDVSRAINVPFYEVDAHNIVPCRVASDKQEYAAYTIRPKINRLLDRFLTEFPEVSGQKGKQKSEKIDWDEVSESLDVDSGVDVVSWIKPGRKEAEKILRGFIRNKLENYSRDRNNPNKDALSNLSPYLHFGQVSSQRIALDVMRYGSDGDEFLEELIIRKELSDNFCFYNPYYNSVRGFPSWARETLTRHRDDRRAYIYTKKQFEQADIHDRLWNAAQMQMVETGKMHGYLRMYWAKKIVEWTNTPGYALSVATYLNDKYELDGRDPNGYTGIAWSVGGVHDRAWGEREIFGKTRYMSFNGIKSKFDVDKFIEKYRK